MISRSPLRRIGSWIAIVAMALNALWPLISQAKPRSVTLVPVCTVAGETHYLELPAGKTPLEQKSSAQGEHCSYCTLSALAPALVFPESEKLSSVQPASLVAQVVQAPLVLSARPRAPPVLQSTSLNDNSHWRTHEEEDSVVRHLGARASDAGRR